MQFWWALYFDFPSLFGFPQDTPLHPHTHTPTYVTCLHVYPEGKEPNQDNRALGQCLLPWFHPNTGVEGDWGRVVGWCLRFLRYLSLTKRIPLTLLSALPFSLKHLVPTTTCFLGNHLERAPCWSVCPSPFPIQSEADPCLATCWNLLPSFKNILRPAFFHTWLIQMVFDVVCVSEFF